MTYDHDKVMRAAWEEQGKVLYEGISSLAAKFYGRDWNNLFPAERQEILDVEANGTQAWWDFVRVALDKEKNETNGNPA